MQLGHTSPLGSISEPSWPGNSYGVPSGAVQIRSCLHHKILIIGGMVLEPDRKSTRLNSSHSQISYAVFCLKKNARAIRSQGSASRSAILEDGASDPPAARPSGHGLEIFAPIGYVMAIRRICLRRRNSIFQH